MAAAGPDPLAGTHLGKEYWVVDRIGDGGMGVVYLVEHRGLKKQFAAKILSRELTENNEARVRFEIEARAASQLDHENIVNVTDYGISVDGRPFLVMELLRGKTLFMRMAEGAVPLHEAAAVIVPVCAALGAAHEAGIVHRDIKPENVFLSTRPGGRFHVKVLDFGIAKATVDTPRVTKLGQVLGSPLYMAPEACRGEDVDGRADIYSVGVLLYQLCTGHLPFEDTNMLRLLQLHTSKPVPPPREHNPALPAEVEAVILKALTKDRESRFQTVEDLAGELLEALPEGVEALLRGPVLTPPPTRTPTPSASNSSQRVFPVSKVTPTINVPTSNMKLGAAAQHAMLEGGPTLMATPQGEMGNSLAALKSSAPPPSPDPGTLANSSSPTIVPSPSLGLAGASSPGLEVVPPVTGRNPTVSASPSLGPSAPARPAGRWRLALLGVLLLAGGVAAMIASRRDEPAVSGTTARIAVPAQTPIPEPPAAPPAPEPTPAVAPAPAPDATPAAPAPSLIRVRITSSPSGAEVLLSGRLLGVTPIDTEVTAASGSAPLELRYHGRRRAQREVALDQDLELAINLDGRHPPRPSPPRAPSPDKPPPSPDLDIRGRR